MRKHKRGETASLVIRIISLAEAASRLGCSKPTLYAWMRLGLLPPTVKVGLRKVGFRSDEFDAAIAAMPSKQSAA